MTNRTVLERITYVLDGLWTGEISERAAIDTLRGVVDQLGGTWVPPDERHPSFILYGPIGEPPGEEEPGGSGGSCGGKD